MKNIKFLFILMAIIFAWTMTAHAYSAVNELDIINIKPAGTGDPAISKENRIFHAYPGIEYNIRAAVVGGMYPYDFKLSNAPEGMTVSSNGTIVWPNPQKNSGIITLTVTDQEGNTDTAKWSINVSKEKFIFVDSKASTNGNGTLNNPYNSMINFLVATNSTGQDKDITYFRAGEYNLEDWRTSDNKGMSLTTNPSSFIAYPGEKVNMIGVPEGGNHTGWTPIYSNDPIYFDSINLSGFSQYGIKVWSDVDYNIIRRCNFKNLKATNDKNNNQGFIVIYRAGDSVLSSYNVIQDNELSHWAGGSAIGSLYDTVNTLIEDNYIHSAEEHGFSGAVSNVGISPKSRCDNMTIRGNKIIMDEGSPLGSSWNSLFYQTNNTEICFNYFHKNPNTDDRGKVHTWNAAAYTQDGSRSQKLLHYYRNTAVGDIKFSFIKNDEDCSWCGPFNVCNNVIINPNNNWAGHYRTHDYISFGWSVDMSNEPWNCINMTDNLKGKKHDNIIDSEGKLTQEYEKYIGKYGYQIQKEEINNELTKPQAFHKIE